MDSKETAGSENETAKPTKGAMRHTPNAAPLHPRDLFGKGGKNPKGPPPKARMQRHQGR